MTSRAVSTDAIDGWLAGAGGGEAAAAARARFARQGLPHRRLEGWRWTDVHAALRDWKAAGATPQAISPSPFAGVRPIEFVIVDGRVETPDEQVAGLRFSVAPASATIPDMEGEGLVSLTVAMSKEALRIDVEAGAHVARPIHIRHVASGATPVAVQVAIRLGDGASATVIETFEATGPAVYLHVNHLDAGADAAVTRHLLQPSAAEAMIFSKCAARIDSGAVFDQTSLLFGAKLARIETLLHFAGPEARARLMSASLLADLGHADMTTNVVHSAPGCQTRQRHKAAIAGQARGVFQGKFHVTRAGQKTDADMQANALLLSDRAEANHKPELEIYADDVQCAHGSTVGALDDAALFYMRQRGLDERAARALLIEAFVGDVFDVVAHKGVEQVYRDAVAGWLERRA